MASRPRQIDPVRLPVIRAGAQLLHRPPGLKHPADVVRAICGVQAQEENAGRLAFRARNSTLTVADVHRAFAAERSLVRTWVMVVDGVLRGTWRLKRSGKKVRVELEPFAKLDAATSNALEAEVADVRRFEG